ncbi:MAG: hypothetical protein JWN94_4273 [Betaproteobacteria bacterium]|nr:hypothetical protein [Betaproteobacteria bacterium]
MSVEHSQLKPGEERVPSGEAAAIDEIKRLTWEMLDIRNKPVQRGQHAKQHGCVDAEFIVEPDLPQEFRHGVLKTARTFKAVVRFSNGAKEDDRHADAHGMAVKLLDIASSGHAAATQDFVMVDHPVFFIRNAADYVIFASALRKLQQSLLARLLAFSTGAVAVINLAYLFYAFFARGRFHEFKIFLKFVAKRPANPLQHQYWSTTPYRLGNNAIRFSARPVVVGTRAPTVEDDHSVQSADLLRESMASQLNLANREARFDILVQLQTDAAAMPVEDPTIAWDEAISPYRKVATLRISPQAFESPERMQYCENLVFSPWHTLPEHRPLGGINRAREVVYAAMSRRRHELNGVSDRGPAKP